MTAKDVQKRLPRWLDHVMFGFHATGNHLLRGGEGDNLGITGVNPNISFHTYTSFQLTINEDVICIQSFLKAHALRSIPIVSSHLQAQFLYLFFCKRATVDTTVGTYHCQILSYTV